MIHAKDHKPLDMFNPFAPLGTKRLALLESSWAHLFREAILHKLPAEKLFPLYDESQGRKTKELYAMLALVLNPADGRLYGRTGGSVVCF